MRHFEMNFKYLYEKYKDLIPYGIFGVLATAVNIGAYWISAHPLGIGVMPSTVIAWIAAVIFAYFTNRTWVFHSKVTGFGPVMKEMLSFFGCRLATGLVDYVIMFVFVELLHYNDVVIKVIANIIVIILNYVASKWFIFAKPKDSAKVNEEQEVERR